MIRHNKQKKLKFQLVMVYVCVVFTVVVLFGTFTLTIFYQNLNQGVIDTLTDKSYRSQLYVMRYFTEYTDQDNQVQLEKVADYFASQIEEASDVKVEIYSPVKRLASTLPGARQIPESEDVSRALTNKSYTYLTAWGENWVSFSSPIYSYDNRIIGVIRYLYPLTQESRQLKMFGLIIGGFSMAAILLTFFAGNYFARYLTRPLYQLRDNVNSMRKGNLKLKNPPIDNAELDELGEAFNQMSERLNEYIVLLDQQQEQLRQFFNNTTHQLKTPLTSIIGYSQMIQLNSDSDQVCEDAFIIEEAGETLLKSIETILEQARGSAGSEHLHVKQFSARTMIEECIMMLKPRLDKHNITTSCSVSEHTMMVTDRGLAREVVLALIDNAILHSAASCLSIWIRTEEDMVEIYIADNGKGITPTDQLYVFQPFYRSETSTTSGNGLGLSVCENFMHRMSGEIRFVSEVNCGTQFLLIFPMLQL